MNSYPAGNSVTVSIPFLDDNGAAISPVGMTLSYCVLDEYENIVQAATPLTAPGTTDVAVSITIAGADNTLPPPHPNYSNMDAAGNPIITTKALREVQLTMTNATGSYVSKVQYVIKAADAQLVLLQNSFQTYNQALLTSCDLYNLTGWNAAVENDRIAAMQMAWLALTKLGYFVRWPRDPDAQNYLQWMDSRNEIIIPRLWQAMTTQRWLTYYPETFRSAMRQAQVVEADQILKQDPLTLKRLAGVFSEKIGESTVMFRSGIPLDLGISKQALALLRGYVNIQYTITRS